MKVRARQIVGGVPIVNVGRARLILEPDPDDHFRSFPAAIDLLVASLAASMASSGTAYLKDVGIEGELCVECVTQLREDCPGHVSSLHFRVTIPSRIPPGRRDALIATLRRNALHNPLHLNPKIDVEVLEGTPTRPLQDSSSPTTDWLAWATSILAPPPEPKR